MHQPQPLPVLVPHSFANPRLPVAQAPPQLQSSLNLLFPHSLYQRTLLYLEAICRIGALLTLIYPSVCSTPLEALASFQTGLPACTLAPLWAELFSSQIHVLKLEPQDLRTGLYLEIGP